MFRIKIRQQKRPGERWFALADMTSELTKVIRLPDAVASESDQLSFQFFVANGSVPSIRVYVGSVLVASSIQSDRAIPIDYDASAEEGEPPLACKGRVLADWVGITELIVKVRLHDESEWNDVVLLPLAVSAGKLEAAQFNQLFSELERDSAAVLLDIHGKTQVGLKGVQPLASSAPVAVLSRVRETIRDLTVLLHQIARQPASRLRRQLTREQALVGQAISETTLAEACRDPSLLGRRGSELVFREHLREHSRLDYRVPEHQVFADFAEYLKVQLSDLRYRIDLEIADRTARRRWRNYAKEVGQRTWWEAEDLPRIEELQRCRHEVGQLRGAVDNWQSLRFLPPGTCLRKKPQSTPLFQHRVLYRRALRIISGHFLTYQATLDTHQLLTRARSLPVLYEWWCAVQLIRILTRGLNPAIHDPSMRRIVSLTQDGRRFTIDFASNQAINFWDSRGARIRFRYQPEYVADPSASGPRVGLLDAGALRTPDMAIEVFSARPGPTAVPDLIMIFDAKYSSLTQLEKLTEVTTKYSKIGNLNTGQVLSRQVWALTPAAPTNSRRREGLSRYCTVDNEAFWSDQFDVKNPVNGAVQTRPLGADPFDPLKTLIVSLLKISGVEYSESE